LCKPFKDDTLGDAERMPYAAVRQFPTPDGQRVSRHDTGLWGDDGYPDPTWPPDGEFGRNPCRRRKNTRRWCKGVVGREHQPGIELRPWYGGKCGWRPLYGRGGMVIKGEWSCQHAEVCGACGKILRDKYGLTKSECPVWRELHAAAATGGGPECARQR
jgi:hypothetical protein